MARRCKEYKSDVEKKSAGKQLKVVLYYKFTSVQVPEHMYVGIILHF